MGVTLERVQNKFACIIGELCSEPAVLSKFAIWLDLRLAEYKSKGSISLDCSGDNPDPFWLNGHEKEETRETPGGESLGDYHYTPRTVPRHPSHSPIHRFPPPGGTSTILPESASKDSMSSGQAAFKKESVTDDQNDVFPVSLHRVETSQERKRSAAEPISKSHESFPSLYPSKVSRIADDMSSALVDQAMGTDTGFTKSYLQGSDDDFDSSNDDTDTEFNSALARSQAGVSSLPKGDNSLTFSSQNSVSVDDSSLQHRLSFQSNTSDPSNLSQDVGSNSVHGATVDLQMSPFSAYILSTDKRSCLQLVRSRIRDKESKSRSTVMHIAQAVSLVENWYKVKYQDMRRVETLHPALLDSYLSDFFTYLRKPDGNSYDPRSLSSFRSYLARYLKDYGYPESLVNSPVFAKSQQAFAVARKAVVNFPKNISVIENSS